MHSSLDIVLDTKLPPAPNSTACSLNLKVRDDAKDLRCYPRTCHKRAHDHAEARFSWPTRSNSVNSQIGYFYYSIR